MTYRQLLALLFACLFLGQANAQVKITEGPSPKEKKELRERKELIDLISKLRAMPGMKKYITVQGFLTQAIIVRDELVGFGVFAGTIWQINPDGSYVVTHIAQRKRFLGGRGKISPRAVLDLAVILKNNDVLSLPSGGLDGRVNPHRTTISFGGRQAVLVLGVDQTLPVGDVTKPAANISGRYAGIITAVQGLAKTNILARPPVPGIRAGRRMGVGRR
ncbi:MAG: hypothetical protein ACFCD0_04030 [Gemmataceae bacterium]